MIALALGTLLATACSSDPTVEAAGGSDAGSSEAESGGDDAAQVWSDSLIAAVGQLEDDQAALVESVDASTGASQTALEVLDGNRTSLSSLSQTLPDPLPGDGLVATRYATFADALAGVGTAAGALVAPPEDGSLWRFGELRDTFADAADSLAAACFALQEAMTTDGLGVLGCVGLTDSVEAAQSIFDSQAKEGLEISVMIASETGATSHAYGETPDRFTLEFCSMMNRDPLGLKEIDNIAAATETLRLESEDGIAVLETWVFPNRAALVEAEASLETMASSARECTMDGPLFTSVWTDTAIDRQQYGPFERYTQIGGFVHPELDTSEGPAFYQLGWAGESNVLGIYSGAGRGDHLREDEVAEAIGIAVVAGTRPAG